MTSVQVNHDGGHKFIPCGTTLSGAGSQTSREEWSMIRITPNASLRYCSVGCRVHCSMLGRRGSAGSCLHELGIYRKEQGIRTVTWSCYPVNTIAIELRLYASTSVERSHMSSIIARTVKNNTTHAMATIW